MPSRSSDSPKDQAVTVPRTVASLIRATATAHPDAPAVVGDGRPVTHRELHERSSALATALLAAGLVPGDRVAYLGRNATEYWELFFAAAKTGLVVVPLNFRLAPAEVEWILQDALPAALVVEEYLVPLVPPGLVGDLGGRTLVFRQGGNPDTWPGWSSFDEVVGAHPAQDPHRDAGGDDLLCLMYSSGTTGRPKGVSISAGGLLWAIDTFGAQFDVSPASVSLVPTPYYHITAGGWALIALTAGGRIVQFTEASPDRMHTLLVRHRATHVIMVPTLIQYFISSPAASQTDYSSVEWLLYGGSPISESVMVRAQELFGARLAQGYGLTETTGVATILGPEDHTTERAGRLRSAGRPVPGVDIEIRHVLTGDVCPPGTHGEVVARGPGVTRGYWNLPQDTADAYLPGGWFRTGDAGYLDADGYLFLQDRLKDVIVSGGENIYPAEVENTIMSHPDVLEAAVIGIPSERWGETPYAIVVPRHGCVVEPADVVAHTRAHLAHYKCPSAVQVVDALPRNPSGKILKRELRHPFWAGRDRTIS
ncbi:long-chain-fatty-acid--CoA ligase [Streptomyces sp. 3214.6]|uniref:long-chain-fatty-acid--CoA ligase n=1 Tax=Streptomyces sp. 3214.6 TaxID=1882757 RepID=UPI00090A3776|nr:long-chain-fatty-acid--CoA ligase [Streptomyces sp. 3214.6]SHI26097.1 long-chain acyl-CoA synthetase [Streptomyces sp. 3214.6]